MPIGPGTMLGAYEVRDVIGQGAMGTVYHAYHAGLARPAAVKVLQALAPDAEATARFRREAQSIARMRHPNVLNVYDFGEFEGTPYMVVEYVPGGTLNDRQKAGVRFGHEDSVRLLEGIGSALDYAHGLGIVHRDVKPANVLLDAAGGPVLADFGLAKLLSQSSLKTASGVTTGTPAYMSPEQVMGAEVGPAADTYALATMAYELLTGAVPFAGEGVLELLYAHVHREPPAASTRDSSLGPEVDRVLATGLAKEPSARWDSSAAFVSALRTALAGPAPAPVLPVEATLAMAPAAAVSPLAAAPPPVTAPPPAIGPTPPFPAPGPARGRRGRILAALAVAAVLVVVAVTIAVLARGGRHGPHLAVTPATVRLGGSLEVSGDGFGSNRMLVTLGAAGGRASVVASDLDAAGGTFDTHFTVPTSLAPGRYVVRACNGPSPGSNCASTQVTVTR